MRNLLLFSLLVLTASTANAGLSDEDYDLASCPLVILKCLKPAEQQLAAKVVSLVRQYPKLRVQGGEPIEFVSQEVQTLDPVYFLFSDGGIPMVMRSGDRVTIVVPNSILDQQPEIHSKQASPAPNRENHPTVVDAIEKLNELKKALSAVLLNIPGPLNISIKETLSGFMRREFRADQALSSDEVELAFRSIGDFIEANVRYLNGDWPLAFKVGKDQFNGSLGLNSETYKDTVSRLRTRKRLWSRTAPSTAFATPQPLSREAAKIVANLGNRLNGLVAEYRLEGEYTNREPYFRGYLLFEAAGKLLNALNRAGSISADSRDLAQKIMDKATPKKVMAAFEEILGLQDRQAFLLLGVGTRGELLDQRDVSSGELFMPIRPENPGFAKHRVSTLVDTLYRYASLVKSGKTNLFCAEWKLLNARVTRLNGLIDLLRSESKALEQRLEKVAPSSDSSDAEFARVLRDIATQTSKVFDVLNMRGRGVFSVAWFLQKHPNLPADDYSSASREYLRSMRYPSFIQRDTNRFDLDIPDQGRFELMMEGISENIRTPE